MTNADRERYLNQWGTKCFLCECEVKREDMKLLESLVPLEKCPDHAEPECIKYYMVCPSCSTKGELI